MRFAEQRARWQRLLPAPQTANPLRLTRRNLYILPSRFGWLWLAVVLLQLLIGIQSQRNGPLLLGYLMLALWLLALLLCHRNLEGLELSLLSRRDGLGFADEPLALPVLLRSTEPRDGLVLQAIHQAPAPRAAGAPCHLPSGDTLLQLPWRAPGRGLHSPGLLRLSSSAPLGLFVCWCRWQPLAPQLVYPVRRAGPVARATGPIDAKPQAGATAQAREGNDSWHDLRPHRPQDSPARVAWKVLAQGRGRHSKQLLEEHGTPPWWGLAAGLPPEQALEHLCAHIHRCAQADTTYGLVLPGGPIAPGRGHRHHDRCLRALALAQLGESA